MDILVAVGVRRIEHLLKIAGTRRVTRRNLITRTHRYEAPLYEI
jgi:hypothetical protein